MRKEADINFSGNHRPLRGERPSDHASTHKFLSDAKSAKLELSVGTPAQSDGNTTVRGF
jgi:hypothetical protein